MKKTVSGYFDENFSDIQMWLFISSYPNTAKLFWRFYLKIKSIGLTINSMKDLDTFYPCMVLLRAQIEHFIVVNYVFYKYMNDHSDSTASLYYEECFLKEHLIRGSSSFRNEIDPSTKAGKIFKYIAKALLDKRHAKLNIAIEDYLKNAKQFNIKNISKYVSLTQSQMGDKFMKPERIKSFLEYYDILSSFIHAGPTADLATFENEPEKLQRTFEENKDWNIGILEAVKMVILFFLAHEVDIIAKDLRNCIDYEISNKKS